MENETTAQLPTMQPLKDEDELVGPGVWKRYIPHAEFKNRKHLYECNVLNGLTQRITPSVEYVKNKHNRQRVKKFFVLATANLFYLTATCLDEAAAEFKAIFAKMDKDIEAAKEKQLAAYSQAKAVTNRNPAG